MPVAPHPLRAEGISALLAGHTAREVSDTLGVPLRTVQLWASQAGVSGAHGKRGAGRQPSARVQMVLNRLGRGDQVAQIAADLGISASAVRQTAARYPVAEKKKSA